MTAKERMRSLKLLELQKNQKEYMENIGILAGFFEITETGRTEITMSQKEEKDGKGFTKKDFGNEKLFKC